MFEKLIEKGINVFEVGGCVRDSFMNITPNDIDFVVECSQEIFESIFPELKSVGENFPVYIIEGNEVALTRTEKCTGNKYQDFDCVSGVSIEEDLGRRDFTCNSIAKNIVTGEIVDPHNGIADIKARIIRCVNPVAFVEDPLRILRGLRFACRFDFNFDDETADLMVENAHRLVDVKHERVVIELKKLWKECEKPSLFFEGLAVMDCLNIHFAPLDALRFVPAGPTKFHGNNTAFDHTMETIDRAKENDLSFDCFIAMLCHDFGKATTDPNILPHHFGHENRSFHIANAWLDGHRFDSSTMSLVRCVTKNHMKMHVLTKMKPLKKVRFFKSIRKEMRNNFFECCNCDHEFNLEQILLLSQLALTFETVEFDFTGVNKNHIVQAVDSQLVFQFKHVVKEIK